MKKLFRTPVGKAINYLLCICSITVWILAIIVAAVMVEEDVYTRSRDDVINEYLKTMAKSQAEDAIFQLATEGEVYKPKSNFEYRIVDADDRIVYETANYTDEYQYKYLWKVVKNGSGDLREFYEVQDYSDKSDVSYIVTITPNMSMPVNDDTALYANLINVAYRFRYSIILIGIGAFVFFVIAFVLLLSSMAHRADTDEIQGGFVADFPFDVEALTVVSVICICIALCDEVGGHMAWVFVCVTIFITICLTLLTCMSMAVKIKNKKLLQGCLGVRAVRGFFGWLRRIFEPIVKNLPLLFKVIIAIGLISLAEFIVIVGSWEVDVILFFWFVEKIIFIPACLWMVLELNRLKEAGEAIANGNLEYKTDVSKLHFDLKKHGENLNSISQGMAIALEDRVRSERMKTELITNVSHDIKTPITSIINYVTLLGENEYSEALIRQSTKLKRLLEDLVEVSKAATGNMEVELVPCNPAIFIDQASGEYEEKLHDARLTLVTKIPDEELTIMADGRRMWRIFDNLMNNACKYSMPDTRLYMTLESQDDRVIISIKNTSRDQLNISEEELMERFVRGDSSRNTEGNGLGLSIAKNLATLQGGELKIQIDGDLFKAVLLFKKH